MGAVRIVSCCIVLAWASAQPNLEIDVMVRAGEAMVQSAMLFETGWTPDRYSVAAHGMTTDEAASEGVHADIHGAYGEFPLRAIAELLAHPAVGPTLSFVDLGSGTGRLLVGVAAMLDKDATVTGIEASSALHLIAEKAIGHLVSQGKLRAGVVRSLLADAIVQPPSPTVARTLEEADLVFCYSTAFPSEDGLRLPQLSAALAALLRAGSAVITTDKVRQG